VQQIFISSKGYEKWLIASIAMLGMCIALEDQQQTIHSVMSIRAKTELRDARVAQEQASAACRDIDKWMLFVMQIFLWKYNHKHDPFQNATPDWKEAASRDEESVPFIEKVARLVTTNGKPRASF
jgi:hypothetical protein